MDSVQGSVRALRTFRLRPGGDLVPISDQPSWTAGVNTAVCRSGHPAPAVGCACGLWAYGNLQALRESDLGEQEQVVAVVRCHGVIVPATLGLRAEHAAIEALWLAPTVPSATRDRIAVGYPQAALYRSLPAMVGEHPPSTLASYRLPRTPRRLWVHLQLVLTLLWWVTALVLLVLALPVDRPVDAPLSWLDPLVLLTPVLVAVATLLAARAPGQALRRLVGLAVQTALGVAGVLLLDPWQSFEQLSMIAGAGGTLHVLTECRAWRLRLGRRGLRGPEET